MTLPTDYKLRFVFGLLAGFVCATAHWIAIGLAVQGDSLGYNPLLLFLSALAGCIAGCFITARYFCMAVVVLAIAAAVFWIVVPDGWWAHEPPVGI